MERFIDLTIPPDKFTIDAIPTGIQYKKFDGNDKNLPKIIFKDPKTGLISFEKSGLITTFLFNGTTILTPLAVNNKSNLNIQNINPNQLEGRLLVLDLKKGIDYGYSEMKNILQSKKIVDNQGNKMVKEKFLIIFRTGLMDKIIKILNNKGIPDYNKLKKIQNNRPGITPQGAEFITNLDIAKTFLIDNISFETQEGGKNGFLSTQILMNFNLKSKKFIPLVYHIFKTSSKEFESLIGFKKQNIRIELGNIPSFSLPGHPVSVKVYRK